MEILLAFGNEVAVLLIHRADRHIIAYFLYNFCLFLKREQIWDLSVIEQIANVLVHRLILHLSIAEQEHHRLLLQTHYFQEFLQFLYPVLGVHLSQIVSGDKRTQSSEGLSARTPDSHKQCVSQRRRYYPHYSNYMLDGIHKKNKVHSVPRKHLVEFCKLLVTNFLQIFQIVLKITLFTSSQYTSEHILFEVSLFGYTVGTKAAHRSGSTVTMLLQS